MLPFDAAEGSVLQRVEGEKIPYLVEEAGTWAAVELGLRVQESSLVLQFGATVGTEE